ncbi:MAG TPA: GNAT family N-acetyltransferase [Nocardioides sp.]|nr:GNAT family N-acetyltransferase [Nocardioides sp.]
MTATSPPTATTGPMDLVLLEDHPDQTRVETLLSKAEASTYAEWFSTLGDPTRVRLLHAVASRSTGVKVGDLAKLLGISQSTCSHHVELLRKVGFVVVDKVGPSSVVHVNTACCAGLPHAADVIMGTLATAPCCPSDLPDGVTTRAMTDDDLAVVQAIYAEGIATRNATFETEVPTIEALRTKFLPGHRWVAEAHPDHPTMGDVTGPDGSRIVGWTAISPVSSREVYSGVGESSVYVTASARGRGIGKALLHRQVTEADAATENGGIWTLQTSIFPENRASIALHRSAGYQTIAVRPRIAQLDGVWRDTVLMERRRACD